MTIQDVLARADLSPEAFVAELQRHAEASVAAHHPLLARLANGHVVDLRRALVTLLREYYTYSRRFTRFLAATTAALECPEHRALLAPNAAEEAGVLDAHHVAELEAAGLILEHVAGPHPALFRRFLDAIGVDPVDLASNPPMIATLAWVESLHDVCRSRDQEQAVGALGIATEGIVRSIYGYLLEAIRRAWPELGPRERAFFELHARVDDDHADVLRGIAVTLAGTPEQRLKLALGAERALTSRAAFFDAVLERVLREDAAIVRRAA